MHGTSCVLHVISVCHVYQRLASTWSLEAVAQLVRCWTVDHRVLSGESSSPLVDCACIHQNSVSTMIFISVLCQAYSTSELTLCNRPNNYLSTKSKVC